MWSFVKTAIDRFIDRISITGILEAGIDKWSPVFIDIPSPCRLNTNQSPLRDTKNAGSLIFKMVEDLFCPLRL